LVYQQAIENNNTNHLSKNCVCLSSLQYAISRYFLIYKDLVYYLRIQLCMQLTDIVCIACYNVSKTNVVLIVRNKWNWTESSLWLIFQ